MSKLIQTISWLRLLAVVSQQQTPVSAFHVPIQNIACANKVQQCSMTGWGGTSIRCRRKSCLFGIMEEIEGQALTAAETWSVEATAFLEPDVATKVDRLFQDRGDVSAFQVLGGRRIAAASDDISNGEGRRSRFVFMHPDLFLDAATAEAEYCTVILVENVNLKASNSIPNALAGIGVDLDNVGDIVITDDSTVYLVVDPTVAKQVLRLLSKELVGVGISLSVVDPHEFMPDGDIQDMKLSRILERKIDRKKFEKGYVHLN